jgi:hypothetical protein
VFRRARPGDSDGRFEGADDTGIDAEADTDTDTQVYADDADFAADDSPVPARRRSWLSRPAAREPEPEDLALPPSTMRGSEAMYGYVVALELVVVSILNLVVTHGAGAPKHPSTSIAIVGLVASIALAGVIRTHHRLIVPFAAIVAAFFATLPKVPNSLSLPHLFALVLPVVYAFVLTQRQRKASMTQVRARKQSGSGAAAAAPETRRSSAGGRRPPRQSRRAAAVPTGPTKNRRYTPPKGKARRR